jgi:hypothetical protein
VVGEFLGLDTEKGIFFLFFLRNYGEWFPKLARLHRTTFTRQGANLWKVKRLLWGALLGRTEHDPAISLWWAGPRSMNEPSGPASSSPSLSTTVVSTV